MKGINLALIPRLQEKESTVLEQPLSKTVVLFGLPLDSKNLCDLEQDTRSMLLCTQPLNIVEGSRGNGGGEGEARQRGT